MTRPISARDYEARFWSKVDVQAGGCWEWQASRKPAGYGQVYMLGRFAALAHRVAYEFAAGAIPEGLQLDHLCRNRGCVNPCHLEPVTNRENGRRGIAGEWFRAQQLAKTECKYGHPYTDANTRITREGWRACRTCDREYARRFKARRK